MDDPVDVSCGTEPGLVCPFEGKCVFLEPSPAKFSSSPAGEHPYVVVDGAYEFRLMMYLNVIQGKQILFLHDETRSPFFFVYEDEKGKPVAICTRQTPISTALGISGGRWVLVPREQVTFAPSADQNGAPDIDNGDE